MNRNLAAALLAAAMSMAHAADGEANVFEGYDDFYSSLPSRLFSPADLRKVARGGLGEPAGDFWKFTLDGGAAHVLELRGPDVILDGRRIAAARAIRFEGEPPAPSLGRTARVFANEEAVCVEGVPSSASGTAVRHVRVWLIKQPYGPQAQRFELPSLFASCLALSRDPDGIGFFKASYRWPEGQPEALGLTLTPWRLQGRRFVPAGEPRTTTFVEPGNLYRFTAP